jgi:hypothetical protein
VEDHQPPQQQINISIAAKITQCGSNSSELLADVLWRAGIESNDPSTAVMLLLLHNACTLPIP